MNYKGNLVVAKCKHCGVEIEGSPRTQTWMHSVPNVGDRRYQYKYCMKTFAEPEELEYGKGALESNLEVEG